MRHDDITVVAYVTKGLADVVQSEIHELVPTATIISAERFLSVHTDGAGVEALISGSRTIDDLRILVAGPAEVVSPADLEGLAANAARRVESLLDDGRAGVDRWSVTVAARNPSWRDKPRWDPGPVLARSLRGADPEATERQRVDLRLQIDRQTAHFSLNLLPRPLGKTDPVATRPGALRPTVAAALVRMAVGLAPDAAGLYDPFCGTGTIVAEADRRGLRVFASDVDPEAVEITRRRLTGLADPVHRVFVHDVLRGVPTRVDVPLTVGNLPWGKQIRLDRRGDLFDAVAAIVARGLDRGGACALLTTYEDQLAARIRRHAQDARIDTRRIGLLGQTPGVVTASPTL